MWPPPPFLFLSIITPSLVLLYIPFILNHALCLLLHALVVCTCGLLCEEPCHQGHCCAGRCLISNVYWRGAWLTMFGCGGYIYSQFQVTTYEKPLNVELHTISDGVSHQSLKINSLWKFFCSPPCWVSHFLPHPPKAILSWVSDGIYISLTLAPW